MGGGQGCPALRGSRCWPAPGRTAHACPLTEFDLAVAIAIGAITGRARSHRTRRTLPRLALVTFLRSTIRRVSSSAMASSRVGAGPCWANGCGRVRAIERERAWSLVWYLTIEQR